MEKNDKETDMDALKRHEDSQNNIKYWKLSNWQKDALAKARLRKYLKRPRPKQFPDAANDPSDRTMKILMASITLNIILVYAVLRLTGKL